MVLNVELTFLRKTCLYNKLVTSIKVHHIIIYLSVYPLIPFYMSISMLAIYKKLTFLFERATSKLLLNNY